MIDPFFFASRDIYLPAARILPETYHLFLIRSSFFLLANKLISKEKHLTMKMSYPLSLL